jgi:hypothetical protein
MNESEDDHRASSDGEAEAQRAADSVRDQIAAVRARIRDARDTLGGHNRRQNETRSFED